ncbi:Asp domain-containing protein [Cephalotus follicularis]|uniref:Asp domain-containing protein n=1 Tax=Cephalotus follicularis TaxID=3775 RepID=A0A1Q3CBU1_CEPFO|nr:Asp domain-containing protein [Cephalotus follicularis]
MASPLLAFTSAINLFILYLSLTSIVEAHNGGFSVELIHRDSPKSPFYNPLETDSQRLARALRRSVIHAYHSSLHSLSSNAPKAEIISNHGEYLMNISIGTPPVPILAIADTGSDLIWTQCKPCAQCFKQDAKLFDPFFSTTYGSVSCSSRQCQNLSGTSCLKGGVCQYFISYGDNSHSSGDLAVDTLTLTSTTRRPVAFPNIVFGCGHDNAATFDAKSTGIVGLSGGNVSLISQLSSSIGGKFSYCLVPVLGSDVSSQMNFGTDAMFSGYGVVSTPLLQNNDIFYYLTLEAVSVGNHRIEFEDSSLGTNEGNIIIDSGTTLTFLPLKLYAGLESAIVRMVRAKRVNDPNGVLNLCYNALSDSIVPPITVHFKGADVRLNPLNTFIEVAESVLCLAIKPITNGAAVYGNLAQMNFLVGYDLEKKIISFKNTDCTMQ